jgi:hypothetical protein
MAMLADRRETEVLRCGLHWPDCTLSNHASLPDELLERFRSPLETQSITVPLASFPAAASDGLTAYPLARD